MLDLLRQRRSVRRFQNQSISADKLKLLCEALLRSPSSRDLQPCEFILVDDSEILDKLASAKAHGTSFFSTAPLAIVIAADPETSDVWIEDSAIAAIVAQLAAEELGLKSCWAQLRLRAYDDDRSASEYVRQLVGLPDGVEVPIVIAVGYPDEDKVGHPDSKLKKNKIHLNQYEH